MNHMDRIKKHLPQYLLIGASGSGKTTLLKNSKIKFIFENKTKGAWTTHNAIILDTSKDHIPHPRKNVMAGVILALSLSDIMDKQNSNRFVNALLKQMLALKKKYGNHLPFYFTITKCDLIPGFLEFFGDYGSDELGQAWGVPLSLKEQNESFSENFISRFNALISRLNKQLITRLYQEQNIQVKFLIKDFPLQLEKLKNEFAKLLRALTQNNIVFNLKSVYLTSATQQPVMQTPATQTLSTNQLHNTLAILQKPVLPSQTYFVKQFLLQGLAPQEIVAHPQKRKMTYLLIISLMITGIVFYAKDAKLNNLKTITTISSESINKE
jgi:type VI protein secretion system component VasK